MDALDRDSEDNSSAEFPAFPVLFQPQEESREEPAQSKGPKLPEADVAELLRLIEAKHDTIYPEMFKETWKDSIVDNFFAL
jgi:hypothetical protein